MQTWLIAELTQGVMQGISEMSAEEWMTSSVEEVVKQSLINFFSDKAVSIWSVEDLCDDYEITTEEAEAFLNFWEYKADATQGLTWGSLHYWASEYGLKKHQEDQDEDDNSQP